MCSRLFFSIPWYNLAVKMDKSVFMLVDGSAIIHRAYHAMPPFTAPDGTPTGAVVGFFSMLLKLIQNIHPTYIAVAFDRGAPTFRQALYADYHANRPKIDSDLSTQFGVVRDILSAIGIPVFELDGYEADDLIGTVNKYLNEHEEELMVYVVTGDRDMLQLVDSDTHVLMPVKGISEVMIYDPERVEAKFGVRPDQIIDLKAFMGDASDNYPGVRGVGPKTASALLQKYGHFERVFESISKIEQENPKLALKLAEGSDMAMLAKKLAALACDAPVEFDLKKCDMKQFDAEKFTKAFAPYEFKTLTRRAEEVFSGAEDKKQMKLI